MGVARVASTLKGDGKGRKVRLDGGFVPLDLQLREF